MPHLLHGHPRPRQTPNPWSCFEPLRPAPRGPTTLPFRNHPMWVKLSSEYVNLDHVFRVRITKGFRNTGEECVAEVESIDQRGQVGTLTRFRGADAQVLQMLLDERCIAGTSEFRPNHDTVHDGSPAQAFTGTVADMKLP